MPVHSSRIEGQLKDVGFVLAKSDESRMMNWIEIDKILDSFFAIAPLRDRYMNESSDRDLQTFKCTDCIATVNTAYIDPAQRIQSHFAQFSYIVIGKVKSRNNERLELRGLLKE
jgi:hypothetical protein